MRLARGTATVTAAAVALGALLPAGAVASERRDGDGARERGDLLSAKKIRSYTAAQAAERLRSEGFDARKVEYGVDAYRLVYRTVDGRGKPTRASGLLVVPRSKSKRLGLVSYAHGTTNYRRDAPSTSPEDGFVQGAPLTYGSAGFATTAPDYLGLGVGPGQHPWMDIRTEASASLDMLRAAREFLPRKGRKARRDVFVTGFSQGASAALGLARELQRGKKWFRLRAVAPIGGAYDMRGVLLPSMLAGKTQPKLTVAYTAYLFVSWNWKAALYERPEEVFKRPYASRVEKYFDGSTPGQVMLQGLPDTLDELLTPRGFDLLEKPSGGFAKALREEDRICRDWTPKVPVRLYYDSRDEQVDPANSTSCHAWLKSTLRRLPATTYGGSPHLGSNLAGTAKAVRWFASL
ncbi:alpha/beta hydrolase family protein [Actinocorallia populi]|uniref:alpha/beta hydrolase family protein n=1 Tax=Actinocorallia populi TaxID=2079200 RepID=UPI0018E4E1C5|nr:hypothetical protein [Actinocorallia populi]